MSQLVPVPVADRSAMRHAMGCWTTGVAVITTVGPQRPPAQDDRQIPHPRFPGHRRCCCPASPTRPHRR